MFLLETMFLSLVWGSVGSNSAQTGASGSGLEVDFVQLFNTSATVGTIVCLLFGFLWAKPSVDRILEDKRKAEEQRDELLQVYEHKILPAMAEATTAVKDITPIMADAVAEIRQIRRERDQK